MSAVFCKTLFMALMDSPSYGYKDTLHTRSRIKRASLAEFLVLQSQRDGKGRIPMNYKGMYLIAVQRPMAFGTKPAPSWVGGNWSTELLTWRQTETSNII